MKSRCDTKTGTIDRHEERAAMVLALLVAIVTVIAEGCATVGSRSTPYGETGSDGHGERLKISKKTRAYAPAELSRS